MKRFTTLVAVIAFLAAGAGLAAANPTSFLIVAKAQGQGSADLEDLVAFAGGTITAKIPQIGVVVASSENPDFLSLVTRDARVQAAAEDVDVQWLPADEPVVEVGPINPVQEAVNAEPLSALQWSLHQIRADQTAANGDQGSGVVRARVAVLDSGIVTNHEDIAANLNLALSKSFVPTEPSLDPPPNTFNHGTHVAGIIAAPINDKGIQGVAPQAELVAIKVLRASGSGQFSWLIEGLMYAASIHADVANMSLGATFDRINGGDGGAGPLIASLNRAITFAMANGVLCVSAAGNEGVNLNSQIWPIPAQSGDGMAIAATGPYGFGEFGFSAVFDRAASYTNFRQSVINVTAPGGDAAFPVTTNCTVGPVTRPCYVFDFVIGPGGSPNLYYFAAGTSMPAPHVSGVAALIVGKYGHMNPSQLATIIENSAVDIVKPGADPYSGRGRIDALAALQ